MKIDRTSRSAIAGRIGTVGYARRAESAAPAAPAGQTASVTSILGIPEAEFTPRVRDAIMGLMQEVDALRREVGQLRERLEVAEHDADQDHLLPLLNRRAFVREVTRSIAQASRYGTVSSLVYFDLDGFKQINDTHGHAAGDAVLAHFANTLLGHVRDSDVVGRLGGDEFGVILSHAAQVVAQRKASTLAETLATAPAEWDGQAIGVAFSYGAFELRAGEDADNAIARADAAMYAHKKNLDGR
jgi:diguanylate cyclase (GGDEF)-like protein